MQPIDTAWNVAKGEAFHPNVAGYMAAGHGGERAARPNAEADNRSRGFPSFVTPSMANMPLRPTLFEGRGKPVGPTGEPDPFEFDFTGHPDQSRKYMQRGLNYPYYFDTKGMADRHDAEQELPMLQRSSDSPIDTAWSILKELSRDDLRHAARTGGIPMTEARRQAYGDEGLPLSTGGGFRTMPDTEAQMMMETQRRFRQGHSNLPPGMTDERFARMGMEDARSNQVHDLDEFGDPNFEPMSDSLEPEGKMGFNLAHASLPNPALVEPYDPEPEIDPELSQFQSRTGTAPSNPFERAIHPIEQKRRQKAYEQYLMGQQRQRMTQARRPQMQQSSRARRPGESKNAYRRRMNRR